MRKLVTLLFISSLLLGACSKDDDHAPQSRVVGPEMQKKVATSVAKVAKEDKKTYSAKLKSLVDRCKQPEFSLHSNPYVYQENEEYVAYKNFILDSSQRFYLLIDTYLRNDVGGWFHWMFIDIVDTRYPGLTDSAYEEAEYTTLVEKQDAFATICVNKLLEELAKEQ